MGKDTIASCKISRMWYNPVCEVMKMAYDNALVAGKLRRWEKYLDDFRLPRWEEIPNLGLYMEQVTVLLREYLDYLPPELKDEQFITAATINNYVRIKVMPEPVKRRYYRVHIAYLIIILTLKQSLSIALIQKVIPMGLSEEEVEHIYTAYASRHRQAAQYFIQQIRLTAVAVLLACVPLGISSDAASFPDFQTAGFSSFRPQSRLAAPRGFSLLALS